MTSGSDIGRLLVVAGVALVLAGLAFLAAGRLGLGRLPGDIVVRRESFTLYVPLATSLLLSVVLTLVFRLLSRR